MLYLLSLLSLFALSWAQAITDYPGYVENGTSTVQYTVQSSGFDGPKIDFYNATSSQWWYFDVVSNDLTESIVLTFMGNSPAATGSPAGLLPFNFIEVNIQLANGALVALAAGAESITITTTGDGSAGVMNGAGYGWSETSDLSTLLIEIDDVVNDFSGTIQFNSDAPYHASCGPAVSGASLLVSPHLGWANSIPDATATVNFVLNNQQISYTGRGYHDSNWGDRPFTEDLGSWYWGHARFGSYSLVWFDMMDFTGVEHQLGYLAEDGAVVANSCGSMPVRPTGLNSAYPPIPGLLPTGFQIVYDMGSSGILEVNVTNSQAVVDYPGLYTRWVGSVVGGIRGQTSYTGIGIYEEMGG
ncbi:hypothetical protein CALVIDRAFT_517254 [Calocera viscosa TUFC12733]|uniref:AttH domain-containing protein n=1 Tax=Calocera viscosa (strain TUFC12733) TaxID=1330018 RepID=A0A167KLU8_CALVF|nr:hypothetical protein CALVIDRAFT_517254 [Calocera viscosa TUFC12733]